MAKWRLTQKQCDRWKRDQEHADCQPDIGEAPADGVNKQRRDLRHERHAEADTSCADTESKAALAIELLGDHRGVRDR